MSTRLIDLAQPIERAFLVAVDTGDGDGWTAEESLRELAALAATAGAEVVGAEWQNRRHADPNWYLGKGRAEELVSARGETGFGLLVADDELSPNQQRALEELLKVKVLDRSGLILDIFAQHAQTHEGRLQVELAQLEYQLPRLTRLWTHLSRTGGGIGTRGPGETQLETDRRVIREKIKKLRQRLETVRRTRDTTARSRERRLVPSVAIVGYTNAGKSTMLNALAGSDAARVEDKLFATLDPTSRSVRLGDGQSAVVTDTVGFIHKLPHQLVDAFRATLDEVRRADVLLEVVDAADGHLPEHRATVQAVLEELGAAEKPRVVAYNKADLAASQAVDGDQPSPIVGETVFVSALTGFGLEALRGRLSDVLASLWEAVDVVVPYAAGELLARVRERGTVDIAYRARDVRVHGRVTPSLAAALRLAADQWRAAGADRGAS
ncbi:MAG TPA: GTPase HflX [Candidatus Sulfotelmatobacter sp.]|nr:GTPase HflX [Candidatus Sulfotelmatobacter sp.]